MGTTDVLTCTSFSEELQRRLASTGDARLMNVREVMSKSIVTIAPEATLTQAVELMLQQRVSCLVVADEGKPVGMLVEGDFLHEIAQGPKDYLSIPVVERMSHPVLTVDGSNSILDAIELMNHRQLRRLPVMEEGQLAGIVTQTDLTRALRSWGKFCSVAEIVDTAFQRVSEHDYATQVARMMIEYQTSYVVAIDNDQPVGILTERDILRKISGQNQDATLVQVRDIMSTPIIHIDASYSIFSASRLMDEKHMHRLLVMKENRLWGVVTQSDVFRAAQERFYAEQRKALEMMEQSCSCLFVLDAQGMVLYTNPSLNRLLELPDSETLMGRPFLPEEYCLECSLETLLVEIEQNGTCEWTDIALQTALGRRLYVNLTATPMRDSYGRMSGIQGVLHDITGKRQAELALAKAHDQLKVANQELKEMQSQLVQNEKMASIGQLAAGVAHELNTPIGFVASNFQTLEKYVGPFHALLEYYDQLARDLGPTESQTAQTLEDIQGFRKAKKIDFMLDDLQELFDESREGLQRVTEIVKNLKDFSRVNSSGGFDDYDLNNGIRSTLLVINNEIKYDAEVTQDLSEVPVISCNGGQVNQVILNICVNAAHALKSQERTEKGRISLKTYHTDEDVICEISDDGPGMPEVVRKRIFEPFFTTKPPGKGTGLGLSVSYDIIVKKHGGTLQVDSVEGKGTTFTIKLPIEREDSGDHESMRID